MGTLNGVSGKFPENVVEFSYQLQRTLRKPKTIPSVTIGNCE